MSLYPDAAKITGIDRKNENSVAACRESPNTMPPMIVAPDRVYWAAAALVAIGLLLTACGSDDDETAATETTPTATEEAAQPSGKPVATVEIVEIKHPHLSGGLGMYSRARTP